MIDQWRRERAQLDKEASAVRRHIESSPNQNKYSSGRAKLRILLNYLSVQRQKVHEKICKYEDEQELTALFQNISGLSESEVEKLMKDMEKLRLIKAG
jgi:hypothetical protein